MHFVEVSFFLQSSFLISHPSIIFIDFEPYASVFDIFYMDKPNFMVSLAISIVFLVMVDSCDFY